MWGYILGAVAIIAIVALVTVAALRQRRHPGIFGVDESRHSSRHNPDASGNG